MAKVLSKLSSYLSGLTCSLTQDIQFTVYCTVQCTLPLDLEKCFYPIAKPCFGEIRSNNCTKISLFYLIEKKCYIL